MDAAERAINARIKGKGMAGVMREAEGLDEPNKPGKPPTKLPNPNLPSKPVKPKKPRAPWVTELLSGIKNIIAKRKKEAK